MEGIANVGKGRDVRLGDQVFPGLDEVGALAHLYGRDAGDWLAAEPGVVRDCAVATARGFAAGFRVGVTWASKSPERRV